MRIFIPFLLTMGVFADSCMAPRSSSSVTGAMDNIEMQTIVDADQADREPDLDDLDWTALAERDAARRELVRALLDAGALRTGKDFSNAALVFQHGSTSNDILLAHILAMTAMAEGHTDNRRQPATVSRGETMGGVRRLPSHAKVAHSTHRGDGVWSPRPGQPALATTRTTRQLNAD